MRGTRHPFSRRLRRATHPVQGYWTGGLAVVAVVLAPALVASPSPPDGGPIPVAASAGGPLATSRTASCPALPDRSDYYSFALEPTGKVAAVDGVVGRVDVGNVESPFALAVTREGMVSRRLQVSLDAGAANGRMYVAWAADPELTTIVRLGTVSEGHPAFGTVAFNKMLVFVTLETAGEPAADRWQGPVALVGRSRSARIQSMASHGSFETEDC